MRPPFKTEEELSDRLASLSELERFDYQRRLEQSSVAVLAAYLEKELAKKAESQALAARSRVTRVNVMACILLLLLGLAAITVKFSHVQEVAWFIAGCWAAYLIATELLFLPQLALKQLTYWNAYQIRAREWEVMLGNSGFAEHMLVCGAQFKGETSEKADTVDLAIRGYALIQAEKAVLLRISVNPISDSGVIRSPANRSFS